MRALRALLASSALFAPTLLTAGAFLVGNASGSAASNVTIPVSFAGDGVTITSQVTVTVLAPLTVVSATPLLGQAACSVDGNSVTLLLFSFSPLPTNQTTYCDIVFTVAPTAPPSPPALPVTASGQLCSTAGGTAPSCTATSGAVTVAGATAAPVIAYEPTAASTVFYSGVGAANAIWAMPSSGAGTGAAATTTVGTCAISGAGAAFPVTTIGQLVFVGASTVAQNLVLPNCVPAGQIVTDATLTCPESRAGVVANRSWILRCPAGDNVFANGFE